MANIPRKPANFTIQNGLQMRRIRILNILTMGKLLVQTWKTPREAKQLDQTRNTLTLLRHDARDTKAVRMCQSCDYSVDFYCCHFISVFLLFSVLLGTQQRPWIFILRRKSIVIEMFQFMNG